MTKLLTTPDGSPASRLAFGTMQFGGRADKDASRAMFEASVSAGINHFDTAYMYNGGASEKILGSLIGDRRDSLLIATKAAYSGGGSRQNILDSFDVSRRRLGIDTIDLLYMHRFDPDTDLAVSIGALTDLQAAGKIRYIGVSNFAAWQVVKANAIASGAGSAVDVLQPMYNLVKRQAEVEILPMCADQSIACIPYSPLGGGLLTGKYASGSGGRLTEDQGYARRYGPKWMHDAAVSLGEIAAETGTHVATLAVAWAAAHPTGPTPIISARSAEQLEPSLAALEFRMDDALYARLAALTPTPPPATDRLEEQS